MIDSWRTPSVRWLSLAMIVVVSMASAGISVARRRQQNPVSAARWSSFHVASVSSVHFFLLYMTLVWLWVLPASLDGILLLYTLARMLSYALPGSHGECVVNYAEKQLMDPTYAFGSNPTDEPYITGLPTAMQVAIGAGLALLAPYTIFVVFATYKAKRPLSAFRVIAGLCVAGYALYGFSGFIAPKLLL